MGDTVKIYVPAQTKKRGVIEFDAVASHYDANTYNSTDGRIRFWSSQMNDKWFFDKASALAAAEDARLKRLSSLRKQIEKLERLGPFVVED